MALEFIPVAGSFRAVTKATEAQKQDSPQGKIRESLE
jgi:hypothetical protein